ncbi:hypothetical protein AHAS_Ahas05G0077000 [Arachis hypogaea]
MSPFDHEELVPQGYSVQSTLATQKDASGIFYLRPHISTLVAYSPQPRQPPQPPQPRSPVTCTGIVCGSLAPSQELEVVSSIRERSLYVHRASVTVTVIVTIKNFFVLPLLPDISVYVDFWEIEPSDSDFFGTDSDEEFPRGDDLDFLDDDLEANEDNPQDKRIAELSREDIMQLQFTDEEVVFRFYKTYAMMHRFAVRLDEVRRDSDGCVIMRQIVFSRAGTKKEEVEKDKRIRDHRPLTRSCCWARIRARLDRKIHKWKVVSFYKEHSHGLVDPLDVSMMPEYRTFSVSDKAQAKNLRDIGIRTCHILRYLAAEKGGYANLSFN